MCASAHSDSHPWIGQAERAAAGIRRRVLAHTLASGGGYLSQACSSAEMLAALYVGLMKLGPSRGPSVPPDFPGPPGAHGPAGFTGASYNGPRARDLDRLVFSPVHYAIALYCTLIEVGRLAPEALESFGRDGSTVELIGAEHSPGHEVTGGSLGQAISQAGGIALARKLRGESGRVWVFLSDGELQEGQVWEALAAMAHHGLDNLAILVDANGQQCDGKIQDVMLTEPLVERLTAFGADALEVDGHDLTALAEAAMRRPNACPLAIIGRTDPCRGVAPLRERMAKLHYIRFRDSAERQRYEQVLEELEREDAP
jgi:transketolase